MGQVPKNLFAMNCMIFAAPERKVMFLILIPIGIAVKGVAVKYQTKSLIEIA